MNQKGNLSISPKGEVTADEENIKSILDTTGEYPEDYVQGLIEDLKTRSTQIQRDAVLILSPVEKTRTKGGIFIDVGLLSSDERKARIKRFHRVVGTGQITNGWVLEAGKHAVWVEPQALQNAVEIPVGNRIVTAIPVYLCVTAVEYSKLVGKEKEAQQ